MAHFVTAVLSKICYHCQPILEGCHSQKRGKTDSSITMTSTIITLLFTLLMIKTIQMRQPSKKEKEVLWVVRQVVPLPAKKVVIFIDPEVHQAEQLTTEEVADKEEKQDRVVFVAKTSKREKTTTLPIVVGVVVGVVFLLLSLLIVLCLRFIRLKSPNFSQEIAHYCKIDRNKSEQEAERGGLPCQVQDGDWGARDDGGKAHL